PAEARIVVAVLAATGTVDVAVAIEVARREDAADLGIAGVHRARRLVVAVGRRAGTTAARGAAQLDAIARITVAAHLVLQLVEAAVDLLEAHVRGALDVVDAGIVAGDADPLLTALDAVAVAAVVAAPA